MKKILLADLIWIAIAVLAGIVWSTHDQNEYAKQLDHLGLSESAKTYASTSDQTISETIAQLEKQKLGSSQILFQTGKLVYVYQTGEAPVLPLSSGQWFTAADFKSELPIAVIGKNVVPSVYEANSQRYLKQGNSYIPVVGVVGTRQGSPLNDATFLNASAYTQNGALTLNQVKIYVDGAATKNAKVKTILHARRERAVHFANAQQDSWWATYGQTAVFLGLLVLAAAATAWLMRFLLGPLPLRGLDADMRARYRRGILASLAGHMAVSLLIGAFIANWWFYFTTRIGYWLFLLGLAVLMSLLLRQLLQQKGASRATS